MMFQGVGMIQVVWCEVRCVVWIGFRRGGEARNLVLDEAVLALHIGGKVHDWLRRLPFGSELLGCIQVYSRLLEFVIFVEPANRGVRGY